MCRHPHCFYMFQYMIMGLLVMCMEPHFSQFRGSQLMLCHNLWVLRSVYEAVTLVSYIVYAVSSLIIYCPVFPPSCSDVLLYIPTLNNNLKKWPHSPHRVMTSVSSISFLSKPTDQITFFVVPSFSSSMMDHFWFCLSSLQCYGLFLCLKITFDSFFLTPLLNCLVFWTFPNPQ